MAVSPSPAETRVRLRRLRLAGIGFLAIAVALLLWIGVLAITLPSTTHVQNWAEAWIGFDLLESTGLAVTGWLVLRRDPRVAIAASATAAFLIADAWFDIVTASDQNERWLAVGFAVFGEIPLAIICFALARSDPRS